MKKRERPSRGIRRPLSSDRLQSSSGPGYWAPRLVVTYELEELPIVSVAAETAEDEARLVAWLGRAGTRERLQECVDDMLAELSTAA